MDREDISRQVDRILCSGTFSQKGQLRVLLVVLVRHMDSGRSLKPDRVIGELWPNDTSDKGSAELATEMSRLRKALAAYYELEGKDDTIAITLPRRSA